MSLAIDTTAIYSDEEALQQASSSETAARNIAQNLHRRTEILPIDAARGLFDDVGRTWALLAASFDPSEQADKSSFASEDSRLELALALAKLERNLVAGLLELQRESIKHEAAIRRFIFNITTFVRIEDPKFFTIQSISAQLLSNLVSPSDDNAEAAETADRILRLYTSGGREEDVVVRLLDSKEQKTNHATLHMLNNLTRNSSSRLTLLLSTSGTRWLAKILGRMDDWLDNEDPCFELSASIFNSFISHCLHPKLFDLLSEPPEPITPSQTTLLKLLDSSLALPPSDHPTPPTSGDYPNTFLVPLFNSLSSASLPSITSRADDPRLPKQLAALMLVTESLSSIGLRVQERIDHAAALGSEDADAGGSNCEAAGEKSLVQSMKDKEQGVVKPLVDLLRALNDFFPKTNPRTTSSDPSPPPLPHNPELKPFTKVKRDLVRLLSILSFEDTFVGDQVREWSGVELVLGMTEIDEGNPYLREHALFCIRNLMRNNPANQDVIKQMNPVGVLSDTGELLPLPEKMKKKAEVATIEEE
ncbi:hypothetical protein B9479_007904 [Cryptococcus floricola]|uniref:Ataxin-10 homolog n=1 Tax=Cryptococcus floricola TaxID=2591691 RepID=A0A5D3ANB9_9TREE|nr:hypothetical protein B9479_007904 [Cryptococcus floricola]